MFGFTENYVKVKFPFDSKLTNTFQSIRLLETDRDGIMKVELINTKETV
jgi:threonylcarbamoyladenosine tRNA methylthiotransferase MtaB